MRRALARSPGQGLALGSQTLPVAAGVALITEFRAGFTPAVEGRLQLRSERMGPVFGGDRVALLDRDVVGRDRGRRLGGLDIAGQLRPGQGRDRPYGGNRSHRDDCGCNNDLAHFVSPRVGRNCAMHWHIVAGASVGYVTQGLDFSATVAIGTAGAATTLSGECI